MLNMAYEHGNKIGHLKTLNHKYRQETLGIELRIDFIKVL